MKTIKVDDEVWEKLMFMKLKEKEKSINKLIEKLLKQKRGVRGGSR